MTGVSGCVIRDSRGRRDTTGSGVYRLSAREQKAGGRKMGEVSGGGQESLIGKVGRVTVTVPPVQRAEAARADL